LSLLYSVIMTVNMHDFGNHNVGKGAAKSGGVNMCKFYSTTEMG